MIPFNVEQNYIHIKECNFGANIPVDAKLIARHFR